MLVLLAVLLAGCLPPSPTISAPGAALEGTEWILQVMQGRPLVEGSRISLEIQDNQAGGLAGCNSYGGGYTIDGSRLRLEELAITAMLCEGQALMAQESHYMNLLTEYAVHNAVAFTVVEEPAGVRLELRDNLGAPLLVYRQKEALAMDAVDLIGTAWELENWENSAVPAEPAPAGQPVLMFVSESEVIGFAGCRNLFAVYQAPGGDDIRITYIEMIEEVCPEDDLVQVRESAFTDLLSNTTDFYLDDQKIRLDLLTAQGDQATFLRIQPPDPGAMDGVEWRLAGYLNKITQPETHSRFPLVRPLGGRAVTLLMNDGQANGSSGCNRYMAAFSREDTQDITFSTPGATKMFCGEPEGIMQQEQSFLQTLAAVEQYQFIPGQLWLVTGDEQVLWFVMVRSALGHYFIMTAW